MDADRADSPLSNNTQPYDALESRFRRIDQLGEIAGMLQWDMAAMMPSGGAETRADQLATLKVMAHELLSDSSTGDLLDGAEHDWADALDPWQRANLKEMRRSQRSATALPADLVSALSLSASRCEQMWRQARAESDFNMVLPLMKEQLKLVREQAKILGAALKLSPYDALLDGYEPDGRSAEIDPVFDDLAAFLPEFIGKALEHQASKPEPLKLKGPFSVEAQRQLGLKLMGIVGFDFNHGRLDTSAHPFCGGVPEDVRITTRYDKADFMRSLMGVLHETGHALYEQGLPSRWRGQPVGYARGMSTHESQSLLMEMQACRTKEFITFAAPLIREAFNKNGPEWEPDNLHRLYTRVERGFIRVDADETTYPAHVILRYRLEKAMIAGDLEPIDLPGAWNAGMQKLLGVLPPDDAHGCLQDIHWYDGAWGYFPTYTLGAMTAAQLFAAAEEAVPNLRDELSRGEFGNMVGWLRSHVHGRASSISAREILVQATGKPLDAGVFKAHLERRYLS
ncbi:MAG TPA: carboxypeptidase M32 [Alphaproteobacteria bacterium]|jgi:carboxypeptidase Taq